MDEDVSTLAVSVGWEDAADRGAAEILASDLALPLAGPFRVATPLWLVWSRDEKGARLLELRVVEPGHPLGGGRGVAVNLIALDTRSPAGRRLGVPLLKSVGIKAGDSFRPHVLDATAGLGEDAWLLAAAGCRVTAVERQPILHALLADGLQRAQRSDPETARRLELLPCADARDVLTLTLNQSPDEATAFEVVLLDPMFPLPPRGRKTLERKPMRMLRLLAGSDPDADKLWPLAAAVAQRRVVVKRPKAAAPLAGRKPTVAHVGKGFRFDVYAGADRQPEPN